MRKLVWIYDNHIYNFLWQKGVRPAVERDNKAGYYRTPNLAAALESYEIQYYIFPNKHK